MTSAGPLALSSVEVLVFENFIESSFLSMLEVFDLDFLFDF